jgi:RNA polymerase sigma-70 factor, ECF subfamily
MNLSRGARLPSPSDPPGPSNPLPGSTDTPAWLAAFHRGDRSALEQCYREHFATVSRAIGTLLGGSDRETVIHELFSRLIARGDLRRSFQGGSFAGWIATVARNLAIDHQRRLNRETAAVAGREEPAAAWEDAAQARVLIDRFRRERLPAAWQALFEVRFLEQLPQRDAAARLSMRRTTLAYRELRIRRLLKRFLLGAEKDPR